MFCTLQKKQHRKSCSTKYLVAEKPSKFPQTTLTTSAWTIFVLKVVNPRFLGITWTQIPIVFTVAMMYAQPDVFSPTCIRSI